jgi:hypothetical protein
MYSLDDILYCWENAEEKVEMKLNKLEIYVFHSV